MRIPFFQRRAPEDLKDIASRSTYVRSAEAAMPHLRSTRTLAENREARERIRRHRANGEPPS